MRRSLRALCQRLERVLADGTRLSGRFEGDRLAEGTATLPDGRRYTGTFDTTHGFPLPDSVLEEDGDAYQGMFNAKWQRHGEGVAVLADGTKYAGRFENDELVHGIVRIPETTGDVIFTGSLKDEQFVKGKMEHPEYDYEGEFENNQPHGKGHLRFTSGATQEGTFFRGKLHGDKCKMRLESGHLYIGTFRDGHITEGELRTATFTYEGEFNEQGMANGEGRAEYLTTHPRLIFTGIWTSGKMTHGTVMDEFGAPVDYANDLDLQQQMGNTKDQIMIDGVLRSALDEKRARFRDMNSSYAADADRVAKQTGKRPTRFDLGYETSVDEELNARLRDQERSRMMSAKVTEEAPQTSQMADISEAALKASPFAEHVDVKKAKKAMIAQKGYQETVQRNANEQLSRFLEAEADEVEAVKATPNLEIDKGNAPWKSWTRDAGQL